MNTTIIYYFSFFVNSGSWKNRRIFLNMNRQFNNKSMRVVKQKTSNFTIIDNRILKDKNLSLKARGLLCFMLQLPDDWIFTESGLAKVTGEGIRSIRSGLKELMEQKYLYRFQCKNENGSFGSMLYYLFEEPTEITIDGENVNTSNTDTKSPETEPPATFNIDKSHPDYDYLNGGWMNE